MVAGYKGHKFTGAEKVFGVGIIGQAMTIERMKRSRYGEARK